jgi:hypothetical protein
MQKITTNHQEIQKWAANRGALPALIDHPDGKADRTGLRLNFPGTSDDELLPEKTKNQSTSWEQFFHLFDEQNLMFVYDTDPKATDPTQWYSFIKNESTIKTT